MYPVTPCILCDPMYPDDPMYPAFILPFQEEDVRNPAARPFCPIIAGELFNNPVS